MLIPMRCWSLDETIKLADPSRLGYFKLRFFRGSSCASACAGRRSEELQLVTHTKPPSASEEPAGEALASSRLAFELVADVE